MAAPEKKFGFDLYMAGQRPPQGSPVVFELAPRNRLGRITGSTEFSDDETIERTMYSERLRRCGFTPGNPVHESGLLFAWNELYVYVKYPYPTTDTKTDTKTHPPVLPVVFENEIRYLMIDELDFTPSTPTNPYVGLQLTGRILNGEETMGADEVQVRGFADFSHDHNHGNMQVQRIVDDADPQATGPYPVFYGVQ